MTEQEKLDALKTPFPAEEIGWKIQATKADSMRKLIVPYVKKTAAQNRLDTLFTPFGWEVSFTEWRGAAQICFISIFSQELNKWVTKADGADDTDVEPIKGGLTDAFKRAAKQWGIGRYLDDLGGKYLDNVGKYLTGDQLKELGMYYRDRLGMTAPKAETPTKPEAEIYHVASVSDAGQGHVKVLLTMQNGSKITCFCPGGLVRPKTDIANAKFIEKRTNKGEKYYMLQKFELLEGNIAA